MNILLLSNSAPNYHYFFNHLVRKFNDDGANVTIAVDCEFSRDSNHLDKLGFEIYEFSSYFANHITDVDLLARYSDKNTNAALLSDFERAEIYGIWNSKDDGYFDRLKSALLSFYENIFSRHNINVVLYENVSNAFAHFALFVAEKHGAHYCGVGGSRLPGRFSITSDPLKDEETSKIFRLIRSGEYLVKSEVRSWCSEYLDNIETIVPDYMKVNGLDQISLLKRYLKWSHFKTIYLLIRHWRDDAYHSFQMGSPVRHYFNLFKRNVGRRLKVSWLSSHYHRIRGDERFILYPMHFHPESSTSILAGTYLDEYEVIRNIAFNLPQGIKLYVKDHSSAHGYPALNFYRKLKNLPNVRVISSHEQTKSLIKKSLMVITLTSTVGYEALLMGKRVLIFGSVFYEFHQNAKKITDPTRLFEMIREAISNEPEDDREYNIDFISAYYLSTKAGSLNLMLKDVEGRKMAENVYSEIYEYCNKQYH